MHPRNHRPRQQASVQGAFWRRLAVPPCTNTSAATHVSRRSWTERLTL
jgi:hypothetical protein